MIRGLAATVAAAIVVAAGAQPLPLRTAPAAGSPPASTARSVLFDAKAAEAQRARQTPLYVERIVVEGRDPDAPRRPARPLEQRFADALLAPPPAAAAGLRPLDTRPCLSLPSTWNTLGSSYAPLAGCP
ncbi:MAG: hypothetical protein ABI593_04960 [Betaproteobacteria bacterium]